MTGAESFLWAGGSIFMDDLFHKFFHYCIQSNKLQTCPAFTFHLYHRSK